jgi:prophage antirepressor-like protein
MNLITKNFNDFEVRILLIDGKEYFIAKDIAELLEYSNPNEAITDHCKKATNLKEILTDSKMLPLEKDVISRYRKLFGNSWQKTKLIQEPDVWRLIIKSKKPEAEKIEEWVFEEVLPSIRKTGKYELPIVNKEASEITFDLDFYISENEKLIKLVKLITSENAITLHYLDKLTQSLNLKSPLELLKIDMNLHYFIPTELGKFFNKSAVEINKILEHKGYQVKTDGVWQLTEKGKEFAISVKNKLFTQIKWKLDAVA